MPSLADVADHAYVDVEDAYKVLVSLVGDGAELDVEDLSTDATWAYVDLANDILDVFVADERALAYPRHSPASDLARAYRETREPALLDELRQRGHADVIPMLRFERPHPDDPPSVVLTRAQMRREVDVWISAAPLDRVSGGRPIRYSLGG